MTDESPQLPPLPEDPSESATIHDAVAAYALNALSTVDRYAFEAHLAECAECRREYARYQAVAHFLPDTLERIEDGRVVYGEIDSERVVPGHPAGETDENESENQPANVDDAFQESEEPSSPFESVRSAEDESRTEDTQSEAVEPDSSDQRLLEGEAPEDDDSTAPDFNVETDTALEIDTVTPEAAAVAAQDETASEDEGEPTTPPPEEIGPDLASGQEETERASEAKRRLRPQGRISTGIQAEPSTLEAIQPGSSRWWWIATGIIGAIGLISFLAALFVMQQNDDLRTERDSLNQQVQDLELAQDQYLDQTPAITFDLVPTTLGSPDATGSIFVDPSGSSAILSVAGMPPQPAERTYQVFYVVPGSETSVAGPLLPVDSGGNGLIAIDPNVTSYTAVGITIEPAAGSDVPSSDPVLQTVINQ